MTSYRYKLARKRVQLRKQREAARDKIGGIATFAFALIMTSGVLMS